MGFLPKWCRIVSISWAMWAGINLPTHSNGLKGNGPQHSSVSPTHRILLWNYDSTTQLCKLTSAEHPWPQNTRNKEKLGDARLHICVWKWGTPKVMVIVVVEGKHSLTIYFLVYHFSIQWIWSSDVLTTVWSCQIRCGKLGHVQDLEGTLVTANNYPRLWDLVAFQNHPKSIVSWIPNLLCVICFELNHEGPTG